MNDARGLIEDYLPIQAISVEVWWEKSVWIHDPAAKLDHAKREIVAARFYEIPVGAIAQTAVSVEGMD